MKTWSSWVDEREITTIKGYEAGVSNNSPSAGQTNVIFQHSVYSTSPWHQQGM